MSNCPGVLISELQTMNFVSEEDYIVINDNNKITKRVSYVDFVGSLNQNPNVRLTTYASDVLILSPLSTENPLWLRFAPKYPVNQEEANNYIVNELVRQKDKLVGLDVRINQLESQDGNYATKKYVDEQIYIEKTEREGADDVLMNIKADKYNHYTKAEIDQMLQDLVIDAGGLPDAPANGEVYGRQDLMWVRVVEEAIADGKQYVRRNRNWEEIIVPDGVTDLGIANRDDETLDITSSTGTSVTIPAASTVLAGLMTAADKAALTQASQGTDLGIDNRNENNFELTSSTGEEVIVPAATSTLSGVMTAADKAGLDALIATGGNTDLAVANNTATNLDVTSSTGTDATLPAATETTAGLLTATDKVSLNNLIATGGITNLGIANRTDSTLDVTSNTGTDATIPQASTTQAGLLTASDKTKLDSVTSGADPNIDPSQTYLGAPTGGRLTLTPGGDTTDLPVVNSTNAGLMAPGDKVKIDAIEDGAQANVATNLGYTPDALQGTVTSSTGTDAVIPAVDEDDAGLMTPQHLYKLENIDSGAEVNVPTNLDYTAAPDGGLVTSSTGTDATLTVVDDDNAGLMTPTQKASLDGLVTTGGSTNLGVDSITSTNLDVTSDNGTDATLPAATTNLAGLMTAADKTKLDALGQTIDFQGNVDLTDSGTIPAAVDGDAYVNTENGVADAGWAAVTNPLTVGEAVSAGDLVIYDGTDWAYVPTGGTQYTDEDVDAHLNTATATAGQILSFDGNDYDWVDPSATVSLGDTPPEPATEDNEGDLWWNTSDGRLYISYTDLGNDSAWVDASPAGGTDGGANVTVAALAPNPAVEGDLWYNSNDGRLYVYYVDSDSSQWVDASPAAENGGEGSGGGIPTLEQVTLAGSSTPYKITTASTESDDAGNTVVTKDFLESNGGGLDLQAVTDVGNTTTNGAILGGGNITLAADGTSDFKSYMRIQRASATTSSQELLSVSSGNNDGGNNRGYLMNVDGFFINTSDSSGGANAKAFIKHDDGSAQFGTGNITLAADGEATFAGNVISGGDAHLGAEKGAQIGYEGNCQFTVGAGSSAALRVYIEGDSSETISLFGDGSATFAAGNISLNANGSANFDGLVTGNGGFQSNRVGDGTQTAFIGYDDGSPTFYVQSSGNLKIGSNVLDAAGSSIELNVDGSAEFAGLVGTQGLYAGDIANGPYAYLTTAGTIDLWPSGAYVLTGRDTSGNTTTQISAVGDATFNGTVDSTKAIVRRSASNDQRIETFGDAVGAKIINHSVAEAGPKKALFIGSSVDDATPSLDASFFGDGSFRVGGDVTGVTDANITLNADGSSNFKGRLVVDRTTAGELLSLQQGGTIHYTFNSVAGDVTTQGLSIGTDIDSLPNDANIFLGLDGSADYAGIIKVGTIDITSDGVGGCEVRNDGLVRSQRPSNKTGSAVFQGWCGNNLVNATSTITAGGSASFADTITSDQSNTAGYFFKGVAADDVLFEVQSDGQLALRHPDGTANIVLTGANGSATFAGYVEVEGLYSEGLITANRTDSELGGVWSGGYSGTPTSTIYASGAASFVGSRFSIGGDATVRISPNADGTDPQLELKADGSASFSSNITAGDGITFTDGTPSGANSWNIDSSTLSTGTQKHLVFIPSQDPSDKPGVLFYKKGVGNVDNNTDVYIGGDLANTTPAPNIKLEASGKITLGAADESSAAGKGINLNIGNTSANILLQAPSTASDTSNIFRAMYGTSESVAIKNNGNATFAGDVTAGSVNGVNVANVGAALTSLKTAAAAATDLDELKAAIASALTNF